MKEEKMKVMRYVFYLSNVLNIPVLPIQEVEI